MKKIFEKRREKASLLRQRRYGTRGNEHCLDRE